MRSKLVEYIHSKMALLCLKSGKHFEAAVAADSVNMLL